MLPDLELTVSKAQLALEPNPRGSETSFKAGQLSRNHDTLSLVTRHMSHEQMRYTKPQAQRGYPVCTRDVLPAPETERLKREV